MPVLKKIANLVSIVLHPIVAPSIIYFMILFRSELDFGQLDKFRFFIFIFATTFLLLALLLVIFRKLGWIASLHMHHRHERRKPLIITLVFLTALSYYLYLSYDVILLSIIMLMISLSTFLILIVTEFWKISVHAAGIGGVMGVLIYLYIHQHSFSLLLVCVATGISIILLASRYILDAHNYLQLIAGFFLAFGLSFFTSTIFIAH